MASEQLNFYKKVAGQIDPQLSKDDGSFQKSWVIVSLTPAYFHRWLADSCGTVDDISSVSDSAVTMEVSITCLVKQQQLCSYRVSHHQQHCASRPARLSSVALR